MNVGETRPDLYIGLVCAAGTDLSEIKRQIKAQLSVVNYKREEIKVSKEIENLLSLKTSKNYYERIISLMDAGDLIRENSENGDGVASLIVTSLRLVRGDKGSATSTAYIIDSLKNPKEVEILDQLYSRNYYTLAIYTSLNQRRENITNQIAQSLHQPLSEEHEKLADEIVQRDQKGSTDSGQSVRDTFPMADFFIDTQLDITAQIKRFIELVFGEPFITPTIDEYMMFVARATALRSCDLSRQVGAVIADEHGSIISTGCNEVPTPRGGFYYEGRTDTIRDNRDKVEQYDPNFHEIERSIGELIEVMKAAGFIGIDKSSSDLAEELIHGDHKKLTSEARIRNLIEFGRVVHAEMHAISQAAMLGRGVKGGTLYCTTYPCHICARHIISAGISQVVYIEPYPKSLTASLYHREMIFENDGDEKAKVDEDPRVVFRSFRGISPTLYQRVFKFRRRKDSYGAVAKWSPEIASPIGAAVEGVRPEFEIFVANGIATVSEKIHSSRNKITTGENYNGAETSRGTNPSR